MPRSKLINTLSRSYQYLFLRQSLSRSPISANMLPPRIDPPKPRAPVQACQNSRPRCVGLRVNERIGRHYHPTTRGGGSMESRGAAETGAWRRRRQDRAFKYRARHRDLDACGEGVDTVLSAYLRDEAVGGGLLCRVNAGCHDVPCTLDEILVEEMPGPIAHAEDAEIVPAIIELKVQILHPPCQLFVPLLLFTPPLELLAVCPWLVDCRVSCRHRFADLRNVHVV